MKNFIQIESDQDNSELTGLFMFFCLQPSTFKLLFKHLEEFYFSNQILVRYALLDPAITREEYLKILVPILEAGQSTLIITENQEIVQHTIQSYRYKGQPFIFNSVSEDCNDIISFYNVSKTIPNILENKLISNLARLDFTALQIHQISHDTLALLQKTNSRQLRLGKIKENIYNCEPVLRDADLINFSISALKYSEVPATERISQSGLTSEEACQIMRYAGISDKLSSCLISGIAPKDAIDEQSANVIAQMIWYFTEAFHIRKGDFPRMDNKMLEYHVTMEELDDDLIFIKSEKSGRWWLRSNTPCDPEYRLHSYYPVDYSDYTDASQGIISDTIVQAMVWLNALPPEPLKTE